jgi:hypothetical protein
LRPLTRATSALRSGNAGGTLRPLGSSRPTDTGRLRRASAEVQSRKCVVVAESALDENQIIGTALSAERGNEAVCPFEPRRPIANEGVGLDVA